MTAVETTAGSAIPELAEVFAPAVGADETLRPANIEEKFAALFVCFKPFREFGVIYGLLPRLFPPLSHCLFSPTISHLFSLGKLIVNV